MKIEIEIENIKLTRLGQKQVMDEIIKRSVYSMARVKRQILNEIKGDLQILVMEEIKVQLNKKR